MKDPWGIVKDGEICIDPQNWQYINDVHDVDDIKKAISDAIRDNDIPMPMRELSEEDASSDFQELLSDIQLHRLLLQVEQDNKTDPFLFQY